VFDIAPSELLLLAVVALVVIGPKELPTVMRKVGHWVGKARGLANQFKSGIDEMIRESELAEMEKHWKAENERIMREHQAAMASIGGNVSSDDVPNADAAEMMHLPPVSTPGTVPRQEETAPGSPPAPDRPA